MRLSEYIVGYLSTLLVCKAVHGGKATGCLGGCIALFHVYNIGHLGGHLAITFSYITCLNKRNLPKANKAKVSNKYYNNIYKILSDNYKYNNSYNSLDITIDVGIAQG